MSTKCHATVIFTIHRSFGEIQEMDPGLIVCKTYIFIKVTFCLTKTENRSKKSLTSSHTIALSKGTIVSKNADFLQKRS